VQAHNTDYEMPDKNIFTFAVSSYIDKDERHVLTFLDSWR
jgi:hypothetical protein